MKFPRFFKTETVKEEKLRMMDRVTGLQIGWLWGDFATQNEKLTTKDKKNAYYGNPIISKGINKKARDLIFDGFEIDSPVDGEDVPEPLENQINEFLSDKQIMYKMHRAIREAIWNGSGWIEWVCAGNKDPEQPLNGELVDIVYVNTETIVGYKFNDDKTDIEYWSQQIGAKTQKIHASRLQPIVFMPDGDNPFGKSPIDIAQRAIKANNDATKALGDNLVMFGHPFPTINTTDNVNTKAVDNAFEELKKLKKKELKVGWAGFKDTKFGLLNPESPSPQYVLQHFYIELAAALEIPMMLLIGEQKGKLTGSEIELNDYYKIIAATQNLFLTPIFHKMFSLLLGDAWKYEIYWNPLFVDEKSESEIKTKYMKEIGELYSKHGVVDIIEARQLLREHDIGIPEGGELDEPEEIEEEPEESIPIEQGRNPVTIRKLTPLEAEIAKKQKELGERLIKEGAAK